MPRPRAGSRRPRWLLGAWEGVVRWQGIRAVYPARPDPDRAHRGHRLGTLFPSLLVTRSPSPRPPLSVSAVLGLVLAVLFTQSAWIERAPSLPYAVILPGHPSWPSRLSIILWVKWIPLALLVCAWLVAVLSRALEHRARARQHRPESSSTSSASTAPRAGRRSGISVSPPPCPIFWAACASAEASPSSGAVVAEFVAGTGARSRDSPSASSRPATSSRSPACSPRCF